MKTIRKYTGKQAGTLGIVALALVVVLAYSVWGSYLLHQQRLSAGQGPTVATSR